MLKKIIITATLACAISTTFLTANAATKPLLVVRFDNSDVDYQEALTQAVLKAKAKKQDVKFHIRAYLNQNVNAEVAIHNAQLMANNMIKLGIKKENITLYKKPSITEQSEVHVIVE